MSRLALVYSHFCLHVATQKKQDLKEEYRQGTAALSDMDSDAPVPREAYRKLSSGVVYADLRVGSADGSEVVKEGSRVNLQWVLRKSNGYFVDSSERNDNVPFIFAVGDGNAIQGVDGTCFVQVLWRDFVRILLLCVLCGCRIPSISI